MEDNGEHETRFQNYDYHLVLFLSLFSHRILQIQFYQYICFLVPRKNFKVVIIGVCQKILKQHHILINNIKPKSRNRITFDQSASTFYENVLEMLGQLIFKVKGRESDDLKGIDHSQISRFPFPSLSFTLICSTLHHSLKLHVINTRTQSKPLLASQKGFCDKYRLSKSVERFDSIEISSTYDNYDKNIYAQLVIDIDRYR